MDIYSRKSRWKLYFLIAGSIIVLITIIYSGYLANKLAENEKNKVILYAKAMESIYEKSLDADVQFEADILEKYNNIPVIMENEAGVFSSGDVDDERSQEYFEKRKEKFLNAGKKPVETTGYARYIYFENSRLYKLITLFPFVQMILLGAFVGFGYLGFSSSRKAEQNRVWVGMAKETAHQLGTPISAIIAWIEHLKVSGINEDQEEIVGELRNDVERLELIADRFSKIGSKPKLESFDVKQEIETAFVYMKRRAPKKVDFTINDDGSAYHNGLLNQHLFAWVVENLLRNALDAMGSTGSIVAYVYHDGGYINVDISDTGKGISASKHKTVFQPGYSTKEKRLGIRAFISPTDYRKLPQREDFC